MAITAQPLASGSGWRVSDIVCDAGPRDRPFEEQHAHACVALVTRGSFQYRTSAGRALLAPGALLFGNAGQCFECEHKHATGDRCLSFHYEADFFAAIAEDAGVKPHFPSPALPPLAVTSRLTAEVEAAAALGGAEALEELAVRVAGAAVRAGRDGRRGGREPSRRDEARVTAILRQIEAAPEQPVSLVRLARQAAMSPYHFLRVFSGIAGIPPHRFLLRTRMQRAAVRLRVSNEPVSAIAFNCGFGDLSTFNRRFRRLMGMNPSAWRRAATSRPAN